MARLRSNFQRGSLSANAGSGDTSISSAEFSALPVVASPDYLMIVLDPDAVHGNPEIVKVTAHTSSATSVTVTRAQESTSARSHNSSTIWRHVPTAGDWEMTAERTTIEATVGSGGDFSTLNEALIDLSYRRPAYVNGGLTATLTMLSGFTMAEQVKLKNIDLGWITLLSEDDEVPIDRATLASTASGAGAFWAERNATLPVIGTFFRYDDSGAVDTNRGAVVARGSKLIFQSDTAAIDGAMVGFGGPVNRLIEVNHGGLMVATSGIRIEGDASLAVQLGLRLADVATASIPFSSITGCSTGIDMGSGSRIEMTTSECKDNRNSNVTSSPGPVFALLPHCDLSNHGVGYYSINASDGSFIYALDCTIGNVLAQNGSFVNVDTGVFGVSDVVRVLTSGRISANSITNGVLSQRPNIVTPDGQIIQSGITSENRGAYVASGDGVTTVFNIAHGLTSISGAPEEFYAIPSTTTADATHAVAADATNIIVTFAVAPASASNNVRFQWFARRRAV